MLYPGYLLAPLKWHRAIYIYICVCVLKVDLTVLDLIVDDGVESRGHRKGVYNPIYEVVGVNYGLCGSDGVCMKRRV